jgi:alpha-ketoglutarate-dependent taurine dioxygenase
MPAMHVIDHGFEATAERLPEAIGCARAWRGAQITKQDCVITLSDAALMEIMQMNERLAQSPLPRLLRRAEHFELPQLRECMRQARNQLGIEDAPSGDGRSLGIAVLDALPMDELEPDAAISVFLIIGQLIGQPVAQKWDGTMLYDVRDSGAPFSYGVRGSITNIELMFHNDNAFAKQPPEVVGLMCFQPAREGGTSRFCSLYAIHEALRAKHPQALERLYAPMLWDRQAEHAPTAAKVLRAPMFRCEGQRLLTRVNTSLIRKGYAIAGEEMDGALRDALLALEAISSDPTLWFEQAIERGHLQYLNNVTTAHYRSTFTDHEDPVRKRHLVRSWHRNHGLPDYDG